MFGWGKKKEADEARKTEGKPAHEPATAVAEPEDRAADLKVKVKERQGCQVTLQVQVPAARVKEATEESFRRIQGSARLPGFRQGKAPLDMIRKNFEGAAWERAVDTLLREAVYLALKKEDVDPVTTPTVDKVEVDPDKPLKFELKAECAPKLELKGYKGLVLQKKSKPVADAEVEKRLEEIREANAKLADSSDGVVADKHFVVADYEGTLEGKPIEGGKAQGQLIEMAAPQTIAGFAEGLRGAKAGETREIPLPFPADHPNKSLAGKAALFKVTVAGIKEKKLPALDDEFAKDVGCESLADLKNRLRQNMERERSRSERQDLERQAADRLLEAHVFDVPPSLVAERAEHLDKALKEHLQRQGASEPDLKANQETLAAKNKVEAERQVRLSYILSAVVRAESISVSDQDVEEAVRKVVEGSEASQREGVRKWMESRRDNLRAQMVEERIFDLLIGSAKVEEAPAA